MSAFTEQSVTAVAASRPARFTKAHFFRAARCRTGPAEPLATRWWAMDALTAARAQMEVSLGFHMIFAALGMALPGFMCLAEALYLRTGQTHYLALAKRWSKATSLLFAIGAVSGTALSFELGLLWPRFMQFSGAIIGSAFALEGYAFFVEAIFIGLYLYGW